MNGSTVILNNGVQIPQLGFGVFQIPPAEARSAVETALESGYRHIDTAAAYNNEAGVGAAVRESGISREQIFITTKLRNGDQGYERALESYDETLGRLGLDYVDLYLIHWPSPARALFVDSWRALERIAADGRVRSIGVSNFLPEHLTSLFESTGTIPAVNQLEIHPTFQQPDAVDFSRSHRIAIEAYSPLGQGADLELPAVLAAAASHGRTPAQVVLRWQVQLGNIVIPKSVSRDRMVLNADIFDFALTAEEVRAISALDSPNRIGGDPRTQEISQIR